MTRCKGVMHLEPLKANCVEAHTLHTLFYSVPGTTYEGQNSELNDDRALAPLVRTTYPPGPKSAIPRGERDGRLGLAETVTYSGKDRWGC